MPSVSPIRTIFPIRCGAGSVNGLAGEWYGPIILGNGLNGVEHDCGSWFFVLVTLSPTEVGALSAQLTQLYDLVPLSFGSRSGGRA